MAEEFLTTYKKDELTPMMQQYLETKEQYKDCILFYRLGDFYEMFFEDAIAASKELELTLTGKQCGMEKRAPMCGIPHHAVDVYLSRLVERGYKVAICEQVEDPKEAKGIVKREVIRIVTPGTNLNTQALDSTRNNYLMCVVYLDNSIGLATIDVTTGDFFLTQVEDHKKLFDEINKFMPTELICNEAFFMSGFDIDDLKNRLGVAVYSLDSWYFDDVNATKALLDKLKITHAKAIGAEDFPAGVIAAGATILYLYETQKANLSHINHVSPYIVSKYMLLDSSTRRNLELCETLREKQKRGSLLWVLDKTKTAMGARNLRAFIEQPLIDKDMIDARLEAVGALLSNAPDREEIREYLNTIYDLERLLGRISYKTANPRDLIAFKGSLSMLPQIKMLLSGFEGGLLAQINDEMDALSDLHDLIEEAIDEDAPITIKEGGILKDGFSETVDQFRKAKTDGKTWLANLEETERERTGIKNLKVKYNKVFGYYLEVTNSYKDLVPDDYDRKQTLVNAERYTMPRLKELEDIILNAEDKLNGLEYELFCSIRDTIADNMERVQKTAKAIALLDVFCSLAYVAERNDYVKPTLNEKGKIEIRNGRHPVVERMIDNDLFICNDTYLDNNKNMISIITGPNMAGKSTYMRQSALIVLMAQIGSFVPAQKANIGIVDRIFTRVGASDDLASGQSTFMVEMNEVANILRNATSNSLLILDEIGRGTSTFDGLSIAWAVIEHISNKRLLGAKTLFATHYHELTELEGKMDNVNNYCIAVKEKGDDIVFLRKIVKGGADKSYGIQVAKLAGVPDMVIDRAKQIVAQLSDHDITQTVQELAGTPKGKPEKKRPMKYDQVDLAQMSLFDAVTDADIIQELSELDISNLTPLDALNTLYKLQNSIKNRWQS